MSAPFSPRLPRPEFAELDRILSVIELQLVGLRHQPAPTAPDPQSALAVARHIYSWRRRRDRFFAGFDIFGEPSWDVLLDLFIASETGIDLAVSAACIGSASPPTTGLRHIDALQYRGLVERVPDPNDRRRIWLRITARGRELMLQCLVPG